MIYWWVGAVVVWLGAAVGVGALVAAMALLAAELAAWGFRRLGVVGRNIIDMKRWRENGCPEWKRRSDGVWQFVPHGQAPE